MPFHSLSQPDTFIKRRRRLAELRRRPGKLRRRFLSRRRSFMNVSGCDGVYDGLRRGI